MLLFSSLRRLAPCAAAFSALLAVPSQAADAPAAAPPPAATPAAPAPSPAAAPDAEPAGSSGASAFDDYQAANETTCVGPVDGHQSAPTVYDVGNFHYVIDGSHAKVNRIKPRTHADIHIGIVNAIKDATDETNANMKDYFAKFKAQDVDAIIVGGDTAYGEDDIQTILENVASNDVPVYAVIGNAETTSAWNRASHAAWQSKKNVINVDLARVVTADGFSLVALAGYYDKRFTSSVAPCLYGTDDLRDLRKLLPTIPAPYVFLTHGPPRQASKFGIDAPSIFGALESGAPS